MNQVEGGTSSLAACRYSLLSLLRRACCATRRFFFFSPSLSFPFFILLEQSPPHHVFFPPPCATPHSRHLPFLRCPHVPSRIDPLQRPAPPVGFPFFVAYIPPNIDIPARLLVFMTECDSFLFPPHTFCPPRSLFYAALKT